MRRNSKGFSYIEILMAMALFSIMLVPILPLIYHARANHADAVQRHHAQSAALEMAAMMRLNPVPSTIANNAREDFIYRLTLLAVETLGESAQVLVHPASSEELLPVNLQKSFGTERPPAGTIFITAEVFCQEGRRIGRAISVLTPSPNLTDMIQ